MHHVPPDSRLRSIKLPSHCIGGGSRSINQAPGFLEYIHVRVVIMLSHSISPLGSNGLLIGPQIFTIPVALDIKFRISRTVKSLPRTSLLLGVSDVLG